jgi:amidase
MELWQQDAATIARMVREKKVSATEVAKAHLTRIDKVNGALNAIVRRMDDEALTAAKKVDASESKGALAGVVLTSKINTDHFGHPTDNGVVAFKDLMPVATHPAVQGLMDAGSVFVGRTNSPALAMRVHTGNALHGETKNPLDPKLTPGGSSGGAGAAVATGMCTIAQGNDIGGSIRWPAFCNGVVGLRPSVGRLPTCSTNIAAPRQLSSQIMSTNGPLARTVGDLRLAFEAMSAPGWDDPNWSPVPLGFPKPKGRIRVALVVDDGLPMCAITREALKTAGKHLEDAGYAVEEASPPSLERIFSFWTRLSRTGLGSMITGMLAQINDPGLTKFTEAWTSMTATPAPGEIDVMVERDLVLRAWNKFFDTYPVMVMPVFTEPSMRANQDLEGSDAVVKLMESARYMTGLPALGLPALAVPVGEHNGLPHGVEIVARRWRDDLCLDAAEEIQKREGVRAVVDPKV